MIKIIAKKDGFRRAGMAHYGTRTYPDGRFTAGQLESLKAEPSLVVEEIPDPPDPVEGSGESEASSAGKEEGTAMPEDGRKDDGKAPARKGK